MTDPSAPSRSNDDVEGDPAPFMEGRNRRDVEITVRPVPSRSDEALQALVEQILRRRASDPEAERLAHGVRDLLTARDEARRECQANIKCAVETREQLRVQLARVHALEQNIVCAETRIASLCEAHEEAFTRAEAAEALLADLRTRLKSYSGLSEHSVVGPILADLLACLDGGPTA